MLSRSKKSFNTLFYTKVGNYFFSLLAQNRWPHDASKVDSHLNESWVHTKRAEFYYIESGLQVQSFDVIRYKANTVLKASIRFYIYL